MAPPTQGDLIRILRLLHFTHGFSVAQCEKIQGALRALDLALVRQVRAHLHGETLFEQEICPRLWSMHLPGSNFSQLWCRRILDRGVLEEELAFRERQGLIPIQQVLNAAFPPRPATLIRSPV